MTGGLVVFALQVWLPNLGLVWSVLTSGTMSVMDKAGFLWASLGAIGTNFTTLGAWLAGLVSLLFGLNLAFTVRYLRRGLTARAGGVGVMGILAAALGVGCSSCGAVVLSFLLGTGATASVVGLLPLAGQEFNLLAVGILAAGPVFAIHRLAQPDLCPVPPARAEPSNGRIDRLGSGYTRTTSSGATGQVGEETQ
ncbi:MAG TPA: hypothetical protein VE569_04210 [Acidimicrobiia bacterium]|nr:hypothetical protein [Acidimicrobiia bacterium]